ncbi:hypothetical protein [Saccharopolyspora hattusasensis]|uniref:hypothetical protein n=1 Tax=Saccharopolyspora hattusasensis TaxID=1128679 RepID=UPI003D979348
MPQAGRLVGPPPARPDGPPSGPMPVNAGPPPAPPAPPRKEPLRPPEQQPPADRPVPRPARAPKLAQRADGGFGPMGSSGTWGASASGRSGYGRNMTWSADDFKEERRDDDLRAGSGYKPGENGSGAVPQFLVEADELFEEEDGGGRLVAPPVLGEAPSSFRDF